jgi:hypothetical protein
MNLAKAREQLRMAIIATEEAQRTWSECVTALHMAEISLKESQKHMHKSYDMLCDSLNGRA